MQSETAPQLQSPTTIFTLPSSESPDGKFFAGGFDLAANPLAFPEQVEAPRNRLSISNYGEGLRTWQPKKIYYVSDTTHFDFFQGKGPQYPPNDISPSRKMPYSRVAAEAWSHYKTQNDFTDVQLNEFTTELKKTVIDKPKNYFR